MSQSIINDIPPYTQATASGGQTVYGTNWTANAASDVVVYSRVAGSVGDDDVDILSYPSQFSVAFIGGLNQVQVTLVTPSLAGDIVTITRRTPADRENLYTNTNFTPSMLNNDFGILTLVDQQAELVNQSIGPRYNYSSTIVPIVDTILPILGAGQVWMKDLEDDEIIAVDFAGGSGGGGEITTWQTVGDPSVNAAVKNGYVTDRVSTPVQIVLPAIFNVGDRIGVLGNGTGGWNIVANTGQTIKFGSLTSSVSGGINSDIPNANIYFRGLVTNSVWTVDIVNSNPSII